MENNCQKDDETKPNQADFDADSLSDDLLPVATSVTPCLSSTSVSDFHLQFASVSENPSNESFQDECAALSDTLSMTNRFIPIRQIEIRDDENQSSRPSTATTTKTAFDFSTIYSATSSEVPVENHESKVDNSEVNIDGESLSTSIYPDGIESHYEVMKHLVEHQMESEQNQKSIFSQVSNVEYRILVSENFPPEILSAALSPPENAMTVSADVHTTPILQKSDYEENKRVEEKPVVKKLLKTNGLDNIEPVGTDSSDVSTDDEIRRVAQAISDIKISNSGTTETLLFGFRGSKKTLKLQEPNLHKDSEDEDADTILSLPTISNTDLKVVTNQPKSLQKWSLKHGIPTQLRILEPVDMILIEEANKETRQLLSATPKQRVLVFKNSFGQKIFYGVESPTFCPIGMYSSGRPFEMSVYDLDGTQIMSLVRKVSCLAGCLIPCLWQQVKTYCPLNVYLGCVEEDVTFCIPKFNVYNDVNVGVFTLRGPIGASICNKGIEFLLYKRGDFTDVGCITDNWIEEDIYRRSSFGIKFPMDIAVKIKILLLSAAVLIKYIYYERKTVEQNYCRTNNLMVPMSNEPSYCRTNNLMVPMELSEQNLAENVALDGESSKDLPKVENGEEFVRLPSIHESSNVSVDQVMVDEVRESDTSSLKELSDVTYEDMVVDSRTSLMNPPQPAAAVNLDTSVSKDS